MLLWRVAAVVWLLIECWLSHTPGPTSGAESRWLAKYSGIEESWLRRAAHVFLFFLLSMFAGLGFGWIEIVGVAMWSFVDELTKVWIPGRHFSWFDVGLNLIGTVAGSMLWLVFKD